MRKSRKAAEIINAKRQRRDRDGRESCLKIGWKYCDPERSMDLPGSVLVIGILGAGEATQKSKQWRCWYVEAVLLWPRVGVARRGTVHSLLLLVTLTCVLLLGGPSVLGDQYWQYHGWLLMDKVYGDTAGWSELCVGDHVRSIARHGAFTCSSNRLWSPAF